VELLPFSHIGAARCEVSISGAALVCDPFSAKNANLSGWIVSLEKKYLRYFGAIADLSGQYGAESQRNFLFGILGGASVGRVGPFAEALFGTVHVQENLPSASSSDTLFAEALGIKIDLRLIRRLSWGNQIDEIKTGSFERRNVRMSSGMAVRF